MPVLYIQNGRHVHFRDKRRCARFRDGRRNRRRARFRDKRRHAPSNTCLLYLHNQRRTIGMCVSLLSPKQTRLIYKLNWDAPKRRSSPFYPPPSQFRSSMMWVRPVFPDQRWSHLCTSRFCVSDLSFLHSVRCIVTELVTHRFSRWREPYTYFIDTKYYKIQVSSANSAYNNNMMNYRENIT
jgi:hypothetical protein